MVDGSSQHFGDPRLHGYSESGGTGLEEERGSPYHSGGSSERFSIIPGGMIVGTECLARKSGCVSKNLESADAPRLGCGCSSQVVGHDHSFKCKSPSGIVPPYLDMARGVTHLGLWVVVASMDAILLKVGANECLSCPD